MIISSPVNRLARRAWSGGHYRALAVVTRLKFPPQPLPPDAPVVMFVSRLARDVESVSPITNMTAAAAKHMQLAQGFKPVFYLLQDEQFDRSILPHMGFESIIRASTIPVEPLSSTQEQWLDKTAALNAAALNACYIDETIPIGRLALASARNLVRKSRLETAEDRAVLRQMLAEGLRQLAIARRLLDEVGPAYIVFDHNTYIDHGGILFHLAVQRGVPTSAWHPYGFDKIMARLFTRATVFEYTFSLDEADWAQLKARNEIEGLVELGKDYVTQRLQGNLPHVSYQPRIGLKYQGAVVSIDRWFSESKPLIGVFTHLPWDASGSFYEDLFPNLADWVEFVAHLALETPAYNWVFRIHPAEHVRGSAEDTEALIRRIIPEDTPHVHVIPADSSISSYALAEYMTAATTVRGTLAAEFTVMDVPVVCAGTGPATVAGVGLHPSDIDSYRSALINADQLPPPTREEKDNAYLFMYWYFVIVGYPLTSLRHFASLRELWRLNKARIIADEGLRQFTALVTASDQQAARDLRVGNTVDMKHVTT